jgi:hypothetical protein
MQGFIEHGYTKQALQTLNNCCQALQVTTLAKSSLAHGKYLKPWAWTNKRNKTSLNSYQWQ